jgi:hypothetical protein
LSAAAVSKADVPTHVSPNACFFSQYIISAEGNQVLEHVLAYRMRQLS